MSVDVAAVRNSPAARLAPVQPRGFGPIRDRFTPERFPAAPCSGARPAEAVPTSCSALSEALREMAISFGARGGIYVHFGHAIHAAEAVAITPARFVASAAADRRLFLNEGSVVLDPVTRRAIRAHTPFAWSSSPEDGAGHAQVSLGARLKAQAIEGGIAIPVQDYAAGPAFINLCYSAFSFAGEAQSLVAAHAPDLSYAAARFHQRAKDELAGGVSDGVQAALTVREIESLRLAALGKTVNEIADFLDVKPRTIEFHLKNAADKLGAPNKLRAVVVAMRCGLIEA